MYVAQNVPAGKLAIPRDANFVRHGCLCQFLLRATDETDLGDRVDADGQQLAHGSVLPGGVCRGNSPLLHRRGRKRRSAHDVARREDVLDGSPVVGTDGDPTALIGLQARTLELEVLRLPWRPASRNARESPDTSRLASLCLTYPRTSNLRAEVRLLPGPSGNPARFW
jgi:hypothetical protein